MDVTSFGIIVEHIAEKLERSQQGEVVRLRLVRAQVIQLIGGRLMYSQHSYMIRFNITFRAGKLVNGHASCALLQVDAERVSAQ